jgi:hypothetical protein
MHCKNTISAKGFIVVLCKFKEKAIIGFKFKMTTMRFSNKITDRGMLFPSSQQQCIARQRAKFCCHASSDTTRRTSHMQETVMS